MPDRLERYRAMRDFGQTDEPRGDRAVRPGERLRFVVQEHHATALHWDFRLEHDGVMASWAVPKGIPLDPKVNHLAVQTEDHPLDYASFQGDIPKDSYGAGKVNVWDHGWYEPHKFREAEVMVTLHGQRVHGKYVLFRTDGKNWIIHRMDPPQDPTREAMPKNVVPMLAKPSPGIPTGSDWAFEIKWDGIRCIAYIDGGRLRLQSRNLNDISAQFPELRPLGESLGALEVVLDGEIVAFDSEGRPSFQRLQNRLGLKGTAASRRSKEVPVVFVIFDLLYLDGHSTMSFPYQGRRILLEQLELAGDAWQVPGLYLNGQSLLVATRDQHLEGVIAKRLSSAYEPGRRSGSWLKVKNHLHQPFIVCGWNQRENASGEAIGAIALGYYEGGELIYAGRVGTGFTEESARQLLGQLRPLSRTSSPFARPIPDAPGHYVEPHVVVDVEFLEWTGDGVLRHPVFKGVRTDHRASDVTRETP